MRRVGLVVIIVLLAAVGVQASGANPIESGHDGPSIAPADADLPIVIEPGAGPGVGADDSGLLINAASGTAEGVPVNARVTYGDPAEPVANPAFTLRNTANRPVQLAVAYTVTSGDGVGDGASNVALRTYDESGELVGTTDEEPGSTALTVASQESAYVVVVVDTTVGDLDPSADLSGTVTVTGG